jgi:hypothetical protein
MAGLASEVCATVAVTQERGLGAASAAVFAFFHLCWVLSLYVSTDTKHE